MKKIKLMLSTVLGLCLLAVVLFGGNDSHIKAKSFLLNNK